MNMIKRAVSKSYMKFELQKEKEFHSEKCTLKYLSIKKKKSDKLLVIFSGFPSPNQNAVYNYVLKFRNLNCNKLYILDDFGSDKKGSYYLGENKDFFIEKAVKDLIASISSEMGVKKENIITCGSSKGGYAALYFSYKYNYGAAVAGAPQILLGDYLTAPHHEHIINYIMGANTESEVEYLNNLLFETIESSEKPPYTSIHISKNEHHYQNHVSHLFDFMKSKGIKYSADIASYNEHNDIGLHFPSYAINTINGILNADRSILTK
ncbi:accessory Sec system protein Asp2 [Priestia megaterium]